MQSDLALLGRSWTSSHDSNFPEASPLRGSSAVSHTLGSPQASRNQVLGDLQNITVLTGLPLRSARWV